MISPDRVAQWRDSKVKKKNEIPKDNSKITSLIIATCTSKICVPIKKKKTPIEMDGKSLIKDEPVSKAVGGCRIHQRHLFRMVRLSPAQTFISSHKNCFL